MYVCFVCFVCDLLLAFVLSYLTVVCEILCDAVWPCVVGVVLVFVLYVYVCFVCD